MIFKTSNMEKEGKLPWLKVADVDDREVFIIEDEIASGRSKYEKEGEASGLIKRLGDGKLFMKTFKSMELDKMTVWGGDSKKWIGKEIEIVMVVSKKWNKPYLATNPVMDIADKNESPF